MATHFKVGFFQDGCVKRFCIGGTTAAVGGLVLILALAASACNCDNPTGPTGNQSTGGNPGANSSSTIVKGKVVGPDGSPVVAASVAVSNSAFPTFAQKTDDDGEFWSDLPEAAAVTVKVTANGFADQSRSVTASAGHSVRADFSLQRQ